MGSLQRVREFVAASGVDAEFREFEDSTRNSELAATALGCTAAEIAKSVVFVGSSAHVVVISGDRRVDVARLSRVQKEEVRVATPEEVREMTGFPIGGVPPFPHLDGVHVLPDASLTRFRHVWAAAGTPRAVVRLATSDLVRLAGSGIFDLAL